MGVPWEVRIKKILVYFLSEEFYALSLKRAIQQSPDPTSLATRGHDDHRREWTAAISLANSVTIRRIPLPCIKLLT
jgi:hypothetical protein